MSWRLANSLIVLRNEVNQLWPKRDKASDGTIGDTRHQKTSWSDHNPNSRGVVCALDLTHDPAAGADMGQVSEYLRTHRHPALKYLIFNKRICSAKTGWRWIRYDGSNPHTRHMHVSVGGSYDNTRAWNVIRLATGITKAKATAVTAAKKVVADVKAVRARPTPKPVAKPNASTRYKLGSRTLRQGARGTDVATVQRFLGIADDGVFGPKTHARVKWYQDQRGLKTDGIVGPVTWKHILSGLG